MKKLVDVISERDLRWLKLNRPMLLNTLIDNDDRNYRELSIMQESKDFSVKKSRKTFKVSVAQYTLEGELMYRYKSIAEASRLTGVRSTSISDCIHERKNSAGGYVWKKIGQLKNCPICKQVKSIRTAFNLKKDGQAYAYCKICMRKVSKENNAQRTL